MLVDRSFRWAVLLAGIFCFAGVAPLLAQPSMSVMAPTSAAVRADQAARRQITIHVGRWSIERLADEIRYRYGINVIVDRPALDDLGLIVKDEIGPFDLADVSLGALLNVALRDLDLTWLVRDEGLVITSTERAEETTEIRVYPVSDLVVVPYQRNARHHRQALPWSTVDPFGDEVDYDSLIEMITTTVDPVTWDCVGGTGSIAPFGPSRALVISQMRAVHEQIGALLMALRTTRKRQGLARNGRGSVSTSLYRSSIPIVARPGPRAGGASLTSRTTSEVKKQKYVYRNNAAWRRPSVHE